MALLSDLMHLEEIMSSLTRQAQEPNVLPTSSEQVILDITSQTIPEGWSCQVCVSCSGCGFCVVVMCTLLRMCVLFVVSMLLLWMCVVVVVVVCMVLWLFLCCCISMNELK